MEIQIEQSDIDLFSDEVLTDPYPVYRQLRDQGSAVYLKSCDAFFIGRFEDVRNALNDWETFSSAQGIGLNPILNKAWEEALIHQDPPIHTERRPVIMQALGPAALRPVAETIDQRADELAQQLVSIGEFDGVADFAHALPVGVVMDLIGWPAEVRPELLRLAEGSWNAAGPANARMQQGLGALEEMMALIADIYDNNRVEPDGYAAGLIAVAHAGQISRETAIGMLAGYIVAAFETTISAMASGIWLYANNPDQWQLLRDNEQLAVQAANEIVRMESPLQNFGRWTTREAQLSDGSRVPANVRVIVSYASANRDERQFEVADKFRIARKERQSVGFGAGPHACAGQGLARMELKAVFGALAKRVSRFELTGTPQRALNNISRGFRSLPMRAIA